MNRRATSQADKYHIVKGSVTSELARRHLAGEVSVGAQLVTSTRYTGVYTTRAIAVDVDKPKDWELLQRAAEQLTVSGAAVFLEPSPLGAHHSGGGHMWIVFTSQVDGDAALRTARKIAPDLRRFWEWFPRCTTPPNLYQGIRLPGGRYRSPFVDAGCELYLVGDPLGARLTGERAILKMWRHQTPAEWVTDSMAPQGMKGGRP